MAGRRGPRPIPPRPCRRNPDPSRLEASMPMRPSLLAWLFPAFRRFPASSGGGVLPVVGVTLPVLLGFAVLAVDAGRYFNLHTSVQWAADALALAAAAELDRKPDAIVRANRAIDNLVANDQRFGDSAGRIARANITARFLTGLPASDATAIGAGFNTTNPIAARFVEIAVQPVPFKSYIAAAASIQGGPTQASGSAVAGFDSVACKSRRCSPATPTRAPRRTSSTRRRTRA